MSKFFSKGKRITTSVVGGLLLSVCAQAQTSAPYAAAPANNKDPIAETFKKVLVDPEISASVNIIDFSGILNSLDPNFEYQAGLQRIDETRVLKIDAWRPRLQFRPTDMGGFGPLYVRFDDTENFILVRQFPNYETAKKNLIPKFDVSKFAMSAANIDNIQPGEMVVVPMELDLGVGFEASTNSGPILLPYGRTGYGMSGLYQVQVLKLAGNKIRLRVISKHSKGPESEVGIHIDPLSSTSWDTKITGKTGFRVTWYKGRKGSLLMADYIFDMNNKEARDAVDSIVSPAGDAIKQLRLTTPWQKGNGINEKFMSTTALADKLAAEDQAKPLKERRVAHISFLRDDFRNAGERLDLGILPANYRFEDVRSRNKVSFSDTNGVEVHYDIPTYDKRERTKVLFGYRRATSDNFAAMVAKTDDKDESANLGDYFVRVDGKNTDVDAWDRNRILHHFRRNVSESVRSYLGVEQFLQADVYHNLQFRARVVINQQSLEKLFDTPKEVLVHKLRDYLKEIDRTGDLPTTKEFSNNIASSAVDGVKGTANLILVPIFGVNLDLGRWNWWLQARRFDIASGIEDVYKIFSRSSGLTNEGRRKAFINLHQNAAWSEIGTGFMMSLIPKEELASAVQVDVEIFAKELKKDHPKGIIATFPQVKAKTEGGLTDVVEYLNVISGVGAMDLKGQTFGDVSTPSGQILSVKEVLERQSNEFKRRAKQD